jgi:hypothetical protein
MPPTTPPAIAPAGVGVGVGVGVSVSVGVGVGFDVDVGVSVVDADAGREVAGPEDEVIASESVAVVVRVVVAVKAMYTTDTEPPLYVWYTVMTVPAVAQPKYVSSVPGKIKISYWQ